MGSFLLAGFSPQFGHASTFAERRKRRFFSEKCRETLAAKLETLFNPPT
jgi:hypothetical protein